MLADQTCSILRGMQTLSQLEQGKEERKSLVTPGRIGKRLASIRVNYTLVVAVVCWFAFALFICFMRLLGFI